MSDAIMTAGTICTACQTPAYEHPLVPRLGECMFRREDGHLGLPHASVVECPACGASIRARMADADDDAIRPQVLTEATPEPPRPWRVVPLDGVCENYWASGPASSYSAAFWQSLVARFNGAPVYVIAARPTEDPA